MSKLLRTVEPLRGGPMKTQSPFLFAVYHLDNYPEGKPDLSTAGSLKGHSIGADFGGDWNMYHGTTVPGFPQHPHRGFETITLVRIGTVDHSDSLGCAGRFSNGDTQWMTAGRGVCHCEMFPQLHTDKPNPLDLFQIWLNLPAKSKMVPPHFKMMWSESAVRETFKNEAGASTIVRAVAGDLGDRKPDSPPPHSWAANPDNHVWVWTLTLEPGASWVIPGSLKGINRSLFFFKGKTLAIGSDADRVSRHVVMELDPTLPARVENPGDDTVELLLLQGRPIDEPVVQHGPFVMNSREEIMDAFADYQSGAFGKWPWKKDDPTHPKEKGRFALYADGHEETPAVASEGAKKADDADKDAATGTGAGTGSGAGAAAEL